MSQLSGTVDLSKGQNPQSFYVCSIPNPLGVEKWLESSQARDYTLPSASWCAMACVRMALLSERQEAPSLETLFAEDCRLGVYQLKEGTKEWVGAYHDPLVSFLQRFCFEAWRGENLNPADVAYALSYGFYSMLSVSPDIRYVDGRIPVKKSGHLVFAYGYEGPKGQHVFRVHNSAGFASLGTQVGVRITEARLAEVFSGRGIFFRFRGI